MTIDGTVFRPYRVGIASTVWCSDDWRITISSTYSDRFTAALDGVYLVGADGVRAKRFQSRQNAMREGVRALRERGAIPHSRL